MPARAALMAEMRRSFLFWLLPIAQGCAPGGSPPPPAAAPAEVASTPVTPSAAPTAASIEPAAEVRVDPALALPEEYEKRIDAVVEDCITRHEIPGAVVLVVRQGGVALRKAYGLRSKEPAESPMTPETVFDLASLTKPVATASSILLLVEQGKLRLLDRAAKHVPEFAQTGKEAVSVEQLLLHTSGLPPVNGLDDYAHGRAPALEKIHRVALTQPPGEKLVYSDLGYVMLGEIVERVSGEPLDVFAKKHLFEPLGMATTTFRPDAALAVRAAPTERRDGHWLQGQVHDPRAELLGGVAGHAGLFSTADDLARFARMILGGGELDGHRILAPATVKTMTATHNVPGGARTLGWDVSGVGLGHTGFTGTSIWLDPKRGTGVILLSSRLHPDGKGDAARLRREVVRIVVEADKAMGSSPKVKTGIDVLEKDQLAALRGRRVGLVTNSAGVDASGRSTAQILRGASGVTLVALFSPEHGLGGDLDRSIGDGTDPSSGLPVYSLYGRRQRPTAEQLAGIDTLVCDLPDVGTRFYTYATTVGYVLEVAAAHHVRVVVLDRPNPIDGETIEGPVLDAGRESFVGYHRIPVRHGMTMGELARMFNDERRTGADLTVVPLEGWRRADRWGETGIRWVNPSPNLRSATAALVYPGVGLLETTNVSVGRGTDRPFERLGAPWIDGARLAAALEEAALPGVRFSPARFTPNASTHAGTSCGGVEIHVEDAGRFESVRTGIEIARQLRRLYRDAWQIEPYRTLLGHKAAFEAIERGDATDAIVASWQGELAEFRARRAKYLLY